MRCPECTERNSVAARVCDSCGYKFKRKPVPVTVWAGLGVVATALTFWGVASAVVPSLTDPSKALTRVAKNSLAGPKSPEHAKQLKSEFNNAIKEFLQAHGKEPSPELTKKLQEILASNAFEVHSFELPRGIRVFEIDTILQASDFIVMNNNGNIKVISVPDFEVFDSAQILNDHARNSLVVIGHSAGQTAHKPQVKVFAVLPDDLIDETNKAIPPIVGEGSANFAANHKDIVADLSLFSVGVAQGLFRQNQPSIGRGEEERIKQNLIWSDGRYTSNTSTGKGALGALYVVARCMQNPTEIDKYSDTLSTKAIQFLKSANIKVSSPNFVIGQTETPSKQRRTPTVSRLLNAANGSSYRVELQKSGEGNDAHVIASNIKSTSEVVVASKPAQNAPNAVNYTAVNATGLESGQHGDSGSSTGQVATVDPTLNHHQATIVEKKPAKKPENKNNISIEDRIINSAKEPQPIKVEKPKDEKPKEDKTKTAEKIPEQKPAEQAGSTTDASKVQIVENTHKSGKYPVDQIYSPALEKTVDGNNINLRKGPSDSYRTLTHLNRGNKVEIVGKKGGWYKVRTNGMEGFIAMSTVDRKTSTTVNDSVKPSAATTVNATKPAQIPVQSSAQNVSKPTVSNNKPAKPETVTAKKPEEKHEKPKETKESTTVKTASVAPSKASKPEKPADSATKSSKPKETSEPMQKGLTTGTLNRNRTIRDENHNAIGAATKGQQVTVLTGLKNGKYKVQLPNGKVGYVDKETVDVVNDTPQFVP